MNLQEAVHYYYAKKTSKSAAECMSRADIRKELEEIHHFSEEEIKLTLSAISAQELAALDPRFDKAKSWKDALFFSYFFILIGLCAIGFSIYALQKESLDPLQQMLPYLVLIGALFLLTKHGARILTKNKPKE